MKFMKTIGEILSPNDPELVEKTLARMAEQDHWNDVFSTKLIALLDTSDKLRGQVRAATRVHRDAEEKLAEAVRSEAAALRLLDEAAKKLKDATESSMRAAQVQRNSFRRCRVAALTVVPALTGCCFLTVLSDVLGREGHHALVLSLIAFLGLGTTAVVWRMTDAD